MIAVMDGGDYVELRAHSAYSFGAGASSVGQLVDRAARSGQWALGLTDRGNFCGALEFTLACRASGVTPLVGVELPVRWGDVVGWAPFWAQDGPGYQFLSSMVSVAHLRGGRRTPEVDFGFLRDMASGGVVTLLGGAGGPLASLLDLRRYGEAARMLRDYQGAFGLDNVALELQQHLSAGDTERNRLLAELAEAERAPLAASNDVWYHRREGARLHDLLVAISGNRALSADRSRLRSNSQYWLKRPEHMARLLGRHGEAAGGSVRLAERLAEFRLDQWVVGRYRLPDGAAPVGWTEQQWLERLCWEAAERRYVPLDGRVRQRLVEEFRLIERHGLAGFLLTYRRIVDLGRACMVELGYGDAETPLEWLSPGRGRGSSVALLVGYLIGLSHVDPLAYDLSLDRFISDDMAVTPDIDLDFPRDIRERLIVRVIEEWGWDHAALAAMFPTYRLRGAVRAAGKALGLPPDRVAGLARGIESGSDEELESSPLARPLRDLPGWRHLFDLAPLLLGIPKGVAQHPGGMLVSGSPLMDLVPVQPAAMAGRYVVQWDKHSVDDARMLKIDLLGLGALSQLHEAVGLVRARTGAEPDLSRIDIHDQAVYDDLCRGDTVGVFQVESAAQMQTIVRMRPRNMYDLALEIGAVRPGVGVNDGVSEFLRRRAGGEWDYTHPLEEGPLARTLGVILFQDQVVQLGMAVAGMSAADADLMRRSLGRPGGGPALESHRMRFVDGAMARGVDPDRAARIFAKFNAFYMFPEGHALAFAATAYQMAWLRRYHSLEFFVALFNQQPMGFWDLDTLKQDARRLDLMVLPPDVNLAEAMCVPEGRNGLRLGLRFVRGVDRWAAERLLLTRSGGLYRDVPDLVSRCGLPRQVLENLALAGALDELGGGRDRSELAWMVSSAQGRRSADGQLSFPFDVPVPPAGLRPQSLTDRVLGEYSMLGLCTDGHVMELFRDDLQGRYVDSSLLFSLPDGHRVRVAGRVVRRQRPLSSAIYLTLEDEFGLMPVMVWDRQWPELRRALSFPLVGVSGRVSRRDGTFNVEARRAWPLRVPGPVVGALPASHDWR